MHACVHARLDARIGAVFQNSYVATYIVFVPSHTGILPIRVWAVPYAYGQLRMGYPYAYGQPIRAYGPKLLLRPYAYDCPYAYRYVGPYKYSCSYDVARGSGYNKCLMVE